MGSSGSHSPPTVAIWAYLAHVMAFVITPCAASMESRPPDLRVVRVVHSFTGRVLVEATHPRLGQVRVFLLKQWTWEKVRSSLPDGYSKFNVELIHNNRPLNAFRALMSLTDEDALEIGYVIKELRVPSPRARRDMTEAIARHQADLVYNYLSRSRHSAQRCAIGAEASLVLCYSIGLIFFAPSAARHQAQSRNKQIH